MPDRPLDIKASLDRTHCSKVLVGPALVKFDKYVVQERSSCWIWIAQLSNQSTVTQMESAAEAATAQDMDESREVPKAQMVDDKLLSEFDVQTA